MNDKRRRGASGLTYALAVGLIGVAAIVAIAGSGQSIRLLFGSTANTLLRVGNDNGASDGGGGGAAADTMPDAFSFAAMAVPATGHLAVSAPVTVTGFTGPLTASVSGPAGSPQIDADGANAWAASVSVNPGSQIRLRMTGASSIGATRTATVTLGSGGASWTVTAGIPNHTALGGYAIAGPTALHGFWWYMGAGSRSCDQVCAQAGGNNLANSAASAFPDNCNTAAATDVTTWFRNNGNPGNWSGSGATGYHTLGYAYVNSNYYGKCATGGNTTAGTFPGETNGSSERHNACPCFVN